MAKDPRFVSVTNKCGRRITIHARFPRPKKPGRSAARPLDSPITLAPGETSRVIALNALIGARNWTAVRECIDLKDTPWTPTFANVTAKSDSVAFDVRVPGKKRASRVKLAPGQASRTVPVSAIPQRRRLEALARRKSLMLVRSYIGPKYSPGAAGSLGSDDVYICDKCGGPIVFRYYPPRPIHI